MKKVTEEAKSAEAAPQNLKELAIRLKEQLAREEQERIRQEALKEAAKRSFAAD